MFKKQKNSKYKNTGIIFESLVKQSTSDILKGVDSSKAVDIIKKYFTRNTEICKENKLYQSLIGENNLSDKKAELLVETILKLSRKLDREKLNQEKYNLIKEIKNNYDLESFFKNRIDNYNIYSSIYNLIEISNSNNFISPQILVKNKTTLLEHLISEKTNVCEDPLLIEYKNYDKGTRFLIYKILINKFNETYSSLLEGQKNLLNEYVNNISNDLNFNKYYNLCVNNIKYELEQHIYKLNEGTQKIKLNEVNNLLKPISDKVVINEDDISHLMNYYELLNELKISRE